MSEIGEPLTDRELDVLVCMAQGASNKEIARQLSISPNTVKVHIRNIFSKLGVTSRTEATTAGLQLGLLTMPGIETAPEQQLPISPESEAPIIVAVPPAELAYLSDTSTDAQLDHVRAELAESGSPEDRGTSRRIVRAAGGILLACVVLIAAYLILRGSGFLSSASGNEQTATSTPEPFVDTPIPDSNWAISRPMSLPRAATASAVIGLDLYQVAGETADGVVNLVEIYALDERRWLQGAPKLTAVANSSAAVLSGEIYVIGGRLPAGQATAAVEAYSPLNDGWRPVTPLPQPTYGGLAQSDGNYIYYFGGRTDDGITGASYRYDPANQTWAALPPMPRPRADIAGGIVTGQVIIVGGVDETGPLTTCELFDPPTESWSTCPDMQQARAGSGSSVLLNTLYVFGGQSGDGSRFSESFDPNKAVWEPIETPMLAEAPEWAAMGVGNVETRIYVFGGRQGDTFLADTYVLTPFTYQFFIPAASSGGEPDQ